MITDYHSASRAILLNAQNALQRGDRQAARGFAMQALVLDPDSEEPWLILAVLASPRASVNYLEQALKINPDSQRAHKGLQWALGRIMREQAKQSLGIQSPPHQKAAEDSGTVRMLPVDSGIPAVSEPKSQPQLQENPAQITAGSGPAADIHLARSIPVLRWSRSVKRFSSRWQNWIGALLVSLFILVAIAAPLISPNNPKSPGPFMVVRVLRLGDRDPHPPDMIPPLGTLPGQFDGFHALVWGARDALIFGLEVVSLTALVGFLLGAIAGYAGGFLSSVLMRVTDAFLAFPVIAGVVFLNQLWVSAVVSVGGFSMFNINNVFQGFYLPPGSATSPVQALFQAINPLVLILVLFSWMPYARITHSIVVSLKQAEFIQAARSIGVKAPRIILRHLLPNSVTPSIVLAARDIGSMVILQATFTFIGLDGSSTWGRILVLGKDWVLGPGGGIFSYWWVYVPATLALVLFGIGWNLLGDGLSELLDPRDN
jgi:peptide/nickel transport system permease protein